MAYTYIEALGLGFPGVQAECFGDGSDYETINWVGGDPMPTKEELDEWILTNNRLEKWKEIQKERDRRKFGGVKLASNGKWFHSDDTSRIQQLGLVMMGANLPPIQWKTMDGTFITMTPAIAAEIFQTTAAKDVAIFTVAEQHKALMLASADPSNYDYMSGSPAWPPIYGE